MIGSISGSLAMLSPPQILIDTVSGLAYEIDVPISDCALLPKVGEQVKLFTHLVIREDVHLLYGFLKIETRNCFRSLIKVSGIGPKIAMALLSTLSVEELHYALDNTKIDILCRTPGVGKKMAERMILELKGKMTVISSSEFLTNITNNNDSNFNIRSDITNALISLGFNDREIKTTLKQIPDDLVDLSHGIKMALKLLNKR